MSSGVVMCSKCKKEVHQNGLKDVNNCTAWTHCSGTWLKPGTPICEGAKVVFAALGELKGDWCGADA